MSAETEDWRNRQWSSFCSPVIEHEEIDTELVLLVSYRTAEDSRYRFDRMLLNWVACIPANDACRPEAPSCRCRLLHFCLILHRIGAIYHRITLMDHSEYFYLQYNSSAAAAFRLNFISPFLLKLSSPHILLNFSHPLSIYLIVICKIGEFLGRGRCNPIAAAERLRR
jgi:hypothetical protein